MLLAQPGADAGFPGLLPNGQDSHYLKTYSIPNFAFPILCLHLWQGRSHPGVSIHISCFQEGHSGHTEISMPLVVIMPQHHRGLTPDWCIQELHPPSCQGTAPKTPHPVGPARSRTHKTPTLPLLPGHSTLMHPPRPSCSQGSFGMYYRAAPREQALEPLGQACADPGTGSG